MQQPRETWRRLQEDGEIRLNSPIEIMRFTLRYSGLLPPQRRKDGRVEEKHDIRRALNLQLWDLWRTRTVLRQGIAEWVAAATNAGPGKYEALKKWEDERHAYLGGSEPKHIVRSFKRGPFFFVPLVTSALSLTCELDVLFLRSEPRGALFGTNGAGDLDNRLKVLFDALKVPTDANQLPMLAAPQEFEYPLLCLLEDDRLITAVRVESERLLDVNEDAQNVVELVVRVTVKTDHISIANLDIVGGG